MSDDTEFQQTEKSLTEEIERVIAQFMSLWACEFYDFKITAISGVDRTTQLPVLLLGIRVQPRLEETADGQTN
jgi:hypothetical protein